MLADEVNGLDCPFREAEHDRLAELERADWAAEKWPAPSMFNFAAAAGPSGLTAQQAASAGAPATPEAGVSSLPSPAAFPCGRGMAPADRDEARVSRVLYPTTGRRTVASTMAAPREGGAA